MWGGALQTESNRIRVTHLFKTTRKRQGLRFSELSGAQWLVEGTISSPPPAMSQGSEAGLCPTRGLQARLRAGLLSEKHFDIKREIVSFFST